MGDNKILRAKSIWEGPYLLKSLHLIHTKSLKSKAENAKYQEEWDL